MATKNLDVQYHQQDTNYYCGAACAQMVLAEIGAGLLDQDDLYNDNHTHGVAESGWYTAPDGLQWTMNNRKPYGSPAYFALDDLNSENAISRMIVWTIFHWNVAPIALVFGSQHWIVVRGFDTSANPVSYNDSLYSINGFDVNNPWPPTPAPAPPPPHFVGDLCGSGGISGNANEHIAYTTWQTDYMTGVRWGHWNGKFVAICDPPATTEFRDHPPVNDRLFDGKHIISPDQAVSSVHEGLKRHQLYERKPWKKNLEKSSPGEPVLVQRLDRLDSFYYIVPFNSKGINSNSLCSVDARFGNYKQSVILPEPAPHMASAYDRKKVKKEISAMSPILDNMKGRLKIRPEAICQYPTLVWKPCLESLSPFWPFHMFTVGSQKIFVRIDGEVFTELHEGINGI